MRYFRSVRNTVQERIMHIIKRAALAADLSLTELAHVINVERAQVSRWAAGGHMSKAALTLTLLIEAAPDRVLPALARVHASKLPKPLRTKLGVAVHNAQTPRAVTAGQALSQALRGLQAAASDAAQAYNELNAALHQGEGA
jgi:transcriptional regulator with XRE-family HTH domain